MYGSVPHNDSNCNPEGKQLILNFIVINPIDNFTNLTVRWFRNNDTATRAASFTEEIISTSNVYQIIYELSQRSLVTTSNCTTGPLYRDTFTLVTNQNFTSELNGYYWCEIVVNGSVSQPSQYAWFYAADSSSCTQQNHFKLADDPECAEFQRENEKYLTSSIDFVTTNTQFPPHTSMVTSHSMPPVNTTL